MISHLDPRLWRDGEDWKKPARMMVKLLEKPDPTAANAGLQLDHLDMTGVAGTDTLFGCLQLARYLLEFIELRHGEAWAKAIFADCARVEFTRGEQIELANSNLLDRYERMKPQPTIADYIRQVAKENEQMPRDLQRGAGSASPLLLYRHYERLKSERAKTAPRSFSDEK